MFELLIHHLLFCFYLWKGKCIFFLTTLISDHTGSIVSSYTGESVCHIYCWIMGWCILKWVCVSIMCSVCVCLCICVRMCMCTCTYPHYYSENLCMLIQLKLWKFMAANGKAFGQQQEQEYMILLIYSPKLKAWLKLYWTKMRKQWGYYVKFIATHKTACSKNGTTHLLRGCSSHTSGNPLTEVFNEMSYLTLYLCISSYFIPIYLRWVPSSWIFLRYIKKIYVEKKDSCADFSKIKENNHWHTTFSCWLWNLKNNLVHTQQRPQSIFPSLFFFCY